ncbi:hypothetical protein [Fusobacterium vincentii ATCC 49256]|uniref:Uncharacterized protein n=1 Tax=Fusobacterium vincentii ATCC 49256 TaxID=209882 RepID=Q7P7A0_FUSVC|nr:hypothetical protein [Fusobacterium vincentii ATCC 49256]
MSTYFGAANDTAPNIKNKPNKNFFIIHSLNFFFKFYHKKLYFTNDNYFKFYILCYNKKVNTK